jgi:hypothetical protein
MSTTPSEEFEFIRIKLEKVGRALVNGEQADLIEAAFMVGCLHTVCCHNVERFRDHKSNDD